MGTDLAWVDTVAGDLAVKDMTAVGATVVVARGGIAIGDGAGGVFTWVSPPQLPADGATVINPPSSGGHHGSWMRAHLDETDVRRYGRLGTAVADAATNTATINAAVAAQSIYQGAVIQLPAGAWPISGTILIREKGGITLRGRGRLATTVYWVGSASPDAMIELRNSEACVIEEMSIRGPADVNGHPDPASAPFAAIESRRYPSGGYANKNHVYRNLDINYSGTTRHGIVFSSSKEPDPACWTKGDPTYLDPTIKPPVDPCSKPRRADDPLDCAKPSDVPKGKNLDLCACCAVDADNDFATLTSVTIHWVEETGMALMQSSSVGHTLVNCAFLGGKYGVACGYSDPARVEPRVQVGGGFTWIGGAVSSHSEADFWINFVGSTGAVSVTGANSEASKRFFLSEPNHMLKSTVSIRDCRISATDLDPNVPETDRIMFDHQAPGPLTLTGCTFHGHVIPIVHLVIGQPTVHHITGNIWSMAGSDREVCIRKEVTEEGFFPTHPQDSYPGGQLVIEEGNVFLGSNDQMNSLGRVNQRRGVEIFSGVLHDTQTVNFESPEPNLKRKNEAFHPTNLSLYYVALSVEVDETNPPPEASRHATISCLTADSFNIRIGSPPGFEKEVRVHWMIMR